MGDTDSAAVPAAKEGAPGLIDPATAEGRSKLLLFAALVPFALGHALRIEAGVQIGVAAVGVAFALNTAGKLVHYRRLPIPARDAALTGLTWVLLALSVLGLLATYALARAGDGSAPLFWPLAVAGVGFGLLHMAAQSKYLPADDPE